MSETRRGTSRLFRATKQKGDKHMKQGYLLPHVHHSIEIRGVHGTKTPRFVLSCFCTETRHFFLLTSPSARHLSQTAFSSKKATCRFSRQAAPPAHQLHPAVPPLTTDRTRSEIPNNCRALSSALSKVLKTRLDNFQHRKPKHPPPSFPPPPPRSFLPVRERSVRGI